MFMKTDKKEAQDKWRCGTWFDIEVDLVDLEKYNQLKEKITNRILTLQELMRKGEEKSAYQKSTILIEGYQALLRILGRTRGEFLG